METYLGKMFFQGLISKLSRDDACANDIDHKDDLVR